MRFIKQIPTAVAILEGNREHCGLQGTVRFYQYHCGVLVEAEVLGLPQNNTGFFGFHIHSGDSCSGADFSATGGHLTSADVSHPRHMGDLPPLLSYNGRGYMAVMTDRFSIRDILGRTVVSHRETDDFTTQPAGNAGEKICCGVIRKVMRKM